MAGHPDEVRRRLTGSETPRHRGSMSHIQMPSATSWGSKFSLRRLGPHPSFHTGNRFSFTFPVLRSRWFTTISVFGYDPSRRAARNTLPSSRMSSGVCPPTLGSRSARTARSKDSGSFAHGFHSSRLLTTLTRFQSGFSQSFQGLSYTHRRLAHRSPVVGTKSDEAHDEPDDSHDHKRRDDHPADPTRCAARCRGPVPHVCEARPTRPFMQPRHRVISLPLLGHDLSIGFPRHDSTHLEIL